MSTYLKTAYDLGAQYAVQIFQKQAASSEDIATGIGAAAPIPLLGPIVGGAVSPKGHRLAGGAGTLLGQLGGGLGGGVAGGALGGLSAYALAKLMGADPEDLVPGGIGLGSSLGALGGGVYGAVKGRRWGADDYPEEAQK